ncbi:tripartite tricarboxylate transporter substrate-binding protein [Xanthobacteraceae bacterium Astr-EGSB]|uniref:Bug family tripartite tricarboxylate transporter substrate binding protein n=1 Tax=Astrobacterium formosum TaxID=3069710 RepID=UPI0027B20521|nr:tripartite tricarboxylate transporter substrate-binding protein [Xanthobacteraceae bacterium Astr-EGSB]
MEGKTGFSRRATMALMLGTAGAGMIKGAPGAFAQAGGYPDRPVKLVVPFAAGGPTDVMARLIGGRLSDNLSRQFFVDNQGGAGGNIGMGAVARAAPDGLTILVVSSSFVVNPGLYARIPYDPFKDFEAITIAGDSPHIFLAHPSTGVKSMKEFVGLVKANPGKYNYASPGAGTGPHLSAELLKLSYKLDLTHVPFRGASPAVQSVVAGHNPFACVALPPAVPLVNDKKIIGLGLTSPGRFPTVPDVPSLNEVGMTGQEATTMQAFLVPAKTPKEIVDFLYQEIHKIVVAPGMKEKFLELGFTPIANTPAQFTERIKIEVAKWTKVIEDAKIEKM